MPKDSNKDKQQPGKKKPKKKPESQGPGMEGTKNQRIKARAEEAAKKSEPYKGVTPGMELEVPFDYDTKGRVGAKGLYNDEILPKLEELASKGLNNNQIARALCIGNKTFYEWLNKYPQFAHSLKKYRGVANIMVENALYNSAVGYHFNEEVVTPKGQIKTVMKFQPGAPSSQIFFLKNMMPHRYRDKIEAVHSLGEGMGQMIFALKRREIDENENPLSINS